MANPTKILLAEDSRFLRVAATHVLEAQGFQVFAAADGEQALKMVSECMPDVVLLDMILPKIQGLDVLKALRQAEATSRLPVLIFSSVADRPDLSPYAPVDFISKDNFMLNALPDRIKAYLAEIGISNSPASINALSGA